MEELSLKWDEHHPAVISVFEELLAKGTLVDCTIAADGQYVKAHKVVLAACSPYFELLFSQEAEKNPIVVLKDMKFQELKHLIDFVYRGQVKLPKAQLDAFVSAAETLQIKGLSGQQTKKISERFANNANKTVSSREGCSSPVPRKRRRSSYTETNEDSQSEPGNESSSDSNMRENFIPTPIPLGVPSTSTASSSTGISSHSASSQQSRSLTETRFPSHDQPSASPEQVLPDVQTVVKTEPEEPTEPLAQVFFPEPKNEEYVDDLAMLESGAGSSDMQGGTSQENTNNYPGYDSSGDTFLMNQMADQNTSSGPAPSTGPAPASAKGQPSATGGLSVVVKGAAAATSAATAHPASATGYPDAQSWSGEPSVRRASPSAPRRGSLPEATADPTRATTSFAAGPGAFAKRARSASSLPADASHPSWATSLFAGGARASSGRRGLPTGSPPRPSTAYPASATLTSAAARRHRRRMRSCSKCGHSIDCHGMHRPDKRQRAACGPQQPTSPPARRRPSQPQRSSPRVSPRSSPRASARSSARSTARSSPNRRPHQPRLFAGRLVVVTPGSPPDEHGFQCPDCGRIFAQFRSLMMHRRMQGNCEGRSGELLSALWKPMVEMNTEKNVRNKCCNPGSRQGCSNVGFLTKLLADANCSVSRAFPFQYTGLIFLASALRRPPPPFDKQRRTSMARRSTLTWGTPT